MKLHEHFTFDDRLLDLYNRVRAELISSDLSEVWSHTRRVIKNLFRVCEGSNIDLNVALIAAIIHDIGYIDTINGHERASALKMKPMLDKWFDHVTVNKVIHCVEAHQFNGLIKPQTVEACALHDADLLDFAGPEGVINLFNLGRDLGFNREDYNKIATELGRTSFLFIKTDNLGYTRSFIIKYLLELEENDKEFKKYGMDNL